MVGSHTPLRPAGVTCAPNELSPSARFVKDLRNTRGDSVDGALQTA